MRKHYIETAVWLAITLGTGCAGCVGFGDDADDGRTLPNSMPPWNQRSTPDASGREDDEPDAVGRVDAASGDGGGVSDVGEPLDLGADLGGGLDTGVAGDVSTGPTCGDGITEGTESCDDAMTADCAGTHDGGDGTCVPAGTCVAGYALNGGMCVPNTTGLSVPCQNGAGFTLFRFHYSNNSTSAQIDVWDANCSYSFAPNSACNVYEICPGFCDPDVTSDGYPIFDSSDYLRARFNVNGLSFSRATLWVQARSYATSSSANFRVWSPLYGETAGGPVDNDFVYDWYSVDWSGFLFPSDDPPLTAIQLYGVNGRVAVKAVELCVE